MVRNGAKERTSSKLICDNNNKNLIEQTPVEWKLGCEQQPFPIRSYPDNNYTILENFNEF